MKLKKLIPLAGIAGVAAVAAPLATSCSEMATEYVWSPEAGTPTITPVERKYKLPSDETIIDVIHQATSDYFADLKADKTLLAKEFINYWFPQDPSNPAPIRDTFKEVSIKTTKVDTKNLTLSYQMKFTIEEPVEANAKTNLYNYNVDVKNVEFSVLPDKFFRAAEAAEDEDPTHVVPLLLCWIMSQHNSNAPRSRILQLIQEQAQKTLIDDSWYINFEVYSHKDDTTQVIHIDRSNALEIITRLLNPQKIHNGMGLSMLLEQSVHYQSTYLNIVWGDK